jgi:hypothetical protein
MSEDNELIDTFENIIKATMVGYEERKIANTPIWVIEHMMPMEEFRKLPIKVQYLLITQSSEIDALHEQIDGIREHLDRTPL